MLIAGYEIYELLQAQERACAKSCFGASWKWSSVFMSLWSRLEFPLSQVSLWLLGTKQGTEMVASQRCLFPFITEETISLLFWPALSLRVLFME